MRYHLQYDFFPVGQGLFASGVLESNSSNRHRIRWVYDCGTISPLPKNLIIDAIRSLEECVNCETASRPNASRPKLDLVAISHFDRDHISGMGALLSKFDVGKLLLPYMPLSQRLMLAFEEGIRVKDPVMQFFVNPVQYVKQIGEAKIEEIILVPASSGKCERSEADNPEGHRNEESLKIEKIESRSPSGDEKRKDQAIFQDNVSLMKEGTSLRVPGIWEFVPYNDAALAPRVTKSFTKAVAGRRDVLTKDLNIEEVNEALRELKELYDKRFGKSSRKRNMISLFLYCGLAKSRNLRTLNILERWLLSWYDPSKLNLNHYETSSDSSRCSILYTGDGYLNTKKRIRALKGYLGKGRIGKLHTFQVMHHGSKQNYRARIAATLKPVVSVFCADPSKYRHPDASVLREFVCYGPVLVGKNYGISISCHFI